MRAGLAAQNIKIPIPTDASPKLSLPAAFEYDNAKVFESLCECALCTKPTRGSNGVHAKRVGVCPLLWPSYLGVTDIG